MNILFPIKKFEKVIKNKTSSLYTNFQIHLKASFVDPFIHIIKRYINVF